MHAFLGYLFAINGTSAGQSTAYGAIDGLDFGRFRSGPKAAPSLEWFAAGGLAT